MPDIEFTASLRGERKLVAAFEVLPGELKHRLLGPIAALTQMLLARVHAREPSRTGSLRQHTRAFVEEKKDRIIGGVQVLPDPSQHYKGAARHNTAAAALEWGAHGTAKVPAQTRTLTEAWGHAIAPQTVLVSAYTRRVNLPELAFLRGPEREMRDEFRHAIEEAVAGMTETFGK